MPTSGSKTKSKQAPEKVEDYNNQKKHKELSSLHGRSKDYFIHLVLSLVAFYFVIVCSIFKRCSFVLFLHVERKPWEKEQEESRSSC
jgi:hypothetical protein